MAHNFDVLLERVLRTGRLGDPGDIQPGDIQPGDIQPS
jgi:hypothetical protein